MEVRAEQDAGPGVRAVIAIAHRAGSGGCSEGPSLELVVDLAPGTAGSIAGRRRG